MTTARPNLRIFLLSRLGWIFYKTLSSTWRIQVFENDQLKIALAKNEPFIFAHWHGQELALMPMIRRYQLATMISTSKDGQIVSYAVKKLAGASSSGSSTRQGVQALLGLVRLVRSGRAASVAVDGPKGPLHQVKPGIFELAKLTNAKIFATGVFVNRHFVFKKSWNQAILPKPFAHVKVAFLPFDQTALAELGPKDPGLQERLALRINDAIHYAQSQMTGNKE